MKKTIIYTVIFLLSIQIALALYGGESFNLYEGECAYLDVNVEIEPEQNLSEYSFNCEFISLGNFTYKFDCPNNYIDLDIIPEINSVGNYTIVTSIFKERYVPSGDGSTHYSRIIKDIPVKRIILEKIIEAEDEDEVCIRCRKVRSFRKKPVIIEAIQFSDELNSKEVQEFLKDTGWNYQDGMLMIKTLEGKMFAKKGDWIIKGVKGEFYPCKPDIFKETYEEVKPNSSHE